jgi:hypothetical protein
MAKEVRHFLSNLFVLIISEVAPREIESLSPP